MTLRQLMVMGQARRELEGEVAAFMVRMVSYAVWAPQELIKRTDLNPFRLPTPMDEAMRKHLEGWERDRWRAGVRANHAVR